MKQTKQVKRKYIKITKGEYLQVVGLFTLAKKHHRELVDIEKAIAYILKEKGEYSSYGHISDDIWGGEYNVDNLLERMNIKVK